MVVIKTENEQNSTNGAAVVTGKAESKISTTFSSHNRL
jgi:hypothetical protein